MLKDIIVHNQKHQIDVRTKELVYDQICKLIPKSKKIPFSIELKYPFYVEFQLDIHSDGMVSIRRTQTIDTITYYKSFRQAVENLRIEIFQCISD